jgi:hypothetical protein
MKTSPLRRLALAAAVALMTLSARAEMPDERWWQEDAGTPRAATVGLFIDGTTFCGIRAAEATAQAAWIVRGDVGPDGRLVETSRSPIGATPAPMASDGPSDATDFFVLPTALVSRQRSTDSPRGEFAVFAPVRELPSLSLWLDMAWHCGVDVEGERSAALAE